MRSGAHKGAPFRHKNATKSAGVKILRVRECVEVSKQVDYEAQLVK